MVAQDLRSKCCGNGNGSLDPPRQRGHFPRRSLSLFLSLPLMPRSRNLRRPLLSLSSQTADRDKEKKRIAFIPQSQSAAKRPVRREGRVGREERKEGWKLFGRGNLFFQSGTLELLSHMRKKGTALSTTTNTHFCEIPSSCVLSH